MSTLDCDSTTRLNTSRTWDSRTDSKNSGTSSELLPGTLVQATEQPKHHANPTTTVQPLARRQHYLSQDQALQVSAVALSTQEPAHHWAITATIPAEVPPVIPRDLEGRCTSLRDRRTVETDCHLLSTSSMDVHLTTTLLVVPCVKLTKVHKAWLTPTIRVATVGTIPHQSCSPYIDSDTH